MQSRTAITTVLRSHSASARHAFRRVGPLVVSLSLAALGCAAEASPEGTGETSQGVVVESDEEGRGPSHALLGMTFEGFHVFSVRRGTLRGAAVRCFYGEASLAERGAVPLTPRWVTLETLEDRYPLLATRQFEAKATAAAAATMTDEEQSSLAVFLYHVREKRVPASSTRCPG